MDEDTAVDEDGAVNEAELAQESYLETPVARHAIPDPSDGEVDSTAYHEGSRVLITFLALPSQSSSLPKH